VGLATICFVIGGVVVEFQVFPYPQLLGPSFRTIRAWHQRAASMSLALDTDLWQLARYEQGGVVHCDRNKAFDGYTLYSSAHTTGASLIDLDGQVVHEWNLPFSQVWERPPHIDHPVPESFINWERVHVDPNGDLLVICVARHDTPWGYGLVKLDRDSKVVWRFADHVHHDFDVESDGTIYTLTQRFRSAKGDLDLRLDNLAELVLDDFIVRLSADGQVLQRISLLEAFANSLARDVLLTIEPWEWDPLHTNSVQVVTPEFAARHEFAKPGQVLVSCRAREMLAIVDLKSAQVMWAACGPFRRQHDADMLDNGHIMVFDNLGHAGRGGPSRVLELDPVTQKIEWSYSGDHTQWLYSQVRSAQQVLPNGNVLINESNGGRLIEVTREGEVVWEFRNPVRSPLDPRYTAAVCGGVRIAASDLDFEFNGGLRGKRKTGMRSPADEHTP
jgi:hypothetical protein